MAIGWESCPRCLARDNVASPLAFKLRDAGTPAARPAGSIEPARVQRAAVAARGLEPVGEVAAAPSG